MMSNDSTINVETKNNKMKKMTKLHLIHLEFILQYIGLTNYYIVKYIFRWINNYNTINVETKTIVWANWQNCIYYNLNLNYNISNLPTITF